MPRKPSSVFVIVETPNTTTQEGLPPTSLQAWRLPIQDPDEVDQAVRSHYAAHPVGTRLFVVDDTKVTGFEVGLTLDEVDDPRLEDPGE